MPNVITVSTLGFDLTKAVPSTIEEYNALAPKRENPVLEDAIKNTIYRGTNNVFRDSFLEELEKVTGTPRINSGTEDSPVWESDGKFFKRIAAASNKSMEDFRKEHQALAQSCYDAAPFDPSVKERTSDGPAIGKRDIANAQELIKRGDAKVGEVAAALSTKLGRTVATDEKSLARALADFRRQKAAEQEAKNNAELGL